MVMTFRRSAIVSNFCREGTRDKAKRSLRRRLCLSRLKTFKTHLLRVRRAKYWAHESGYSVCKKKKTNPNVTNFRRMGQVYFLFQATRGQIKNQIFWPRTPPCMGEGTK